MTVSSRAHSAASETESGDSVPGEEMPRTRSERNLTHSHNNTTQHTSAAMASILAPSPRRGFFGNRGGGGLFGRRTVVSSGVRFSLTARESAADSREHSRWAAAAEAASRGAAASWAQPARAWYVAPVPTFVVLASHACRFPAARHWRRRRRGASSVGRAPRGGARGRRRRRLRAHNRGAADPLAPPVHVNAAAGGTE